MRGDDVRVGDCYVQERSRLVREVIQERPNGDVFWRSYELATGEPTGDSFVCSTGYLLKWATRKATPEEIARLDRRAALRQGFEREQELVGLFLAALSDDDLLDEVCRRGLACGVV